MWAATAPEPSPGRPVLRPAPVREPPFDDEATGRHLSLVGPLDQPLPFRTAEPGNRSGLRLATTSQSGSLPPGRPNLPDPSAYGRRLVIAVIEAATGRRSPHQLSQHTTPAVLAGLLRDAGKISRLGTAARPASVHSLRVVEPADGVAEIVAVVRVGVRFRAIALRLEGADGRWRCVRLQIG
ncbi:MAG: Rv3235 family protein [Jatrophihabitans sp.]